ncbi:transcriptional regulator [Actinomadura sp. DC4]|uniref:transcriptional regulator n=1 Tax=Actinomadura sp. DC4 TaxID=3055069 RepID=UPI0025B0B8C5|nr:transcriptional regulator [Actinomadura sp. DC4]MDN3357914.1 transcriptional regulator [Actinomadura sp. DC4]
MTNPPHRTGTDLLVLHSLRCVGFAHLARVSRAAGLTAPDVESELIDLAVAGLVTRVPGEFGGWGLTEAGRAADAERIGAELDAAGARAAVTRAYEDFLVLNPELLDLCTAWQLRPGDGVPTPNDHADPTYDARVLELFTDFDRRADGVCAALGAALLRFRRYRDRLTGALTRARAGELDCVADGLESYHGVWFQLHEDLLVTLGLPRHR